MLVHVCYCTNLLSVTTNLPTKHPQGKVELCHQFPLKNSPPLGKTEGSASSVLSYLSCAHIKGALAFKQQQSQKQEWKTWGEGRGMWCDAFSNSCIHSVFLRGKGEREKGRKAALFHSELISGFQNALLLQPTNPSTPRCWGSLISKGAQTHKSTHTIAFFNPSIFLLANAHSHTHACLFAHTLQWGLP